MWAVQAARPWPLQVHQQRLAALAVLVAQKPPISPVVTVALAEVPQLRVGQLVQLVELAEPVA